MIILGIEFLGLVVICYIFLVYAMSKNVSGGKRKLTPAKAVALVALLIIAFLMFASWYINLGLSS